MRGDPGADAGGAGGSAWLVLAAILAAGPLRAEPAPGPVWPEPPDQPRLRYVGVLPDPAALTTAEGSFFTRMFRYVTGAGSASANAQPPLGRPTGLCVSGGTLFVADPERRAIVRIPVGGGAITAWKGSRLEPFQSPVGVAAAPDGGVWMTDSERAWVRRLDADGGKVADLAAPGERWARPTGIAFDSTRGRLYVADTNRHAIRVFATSGEYVRGWGTRGTGDGEFNFPTYLWIEPRTGDLLVCDSGNFRVQRFGSDGTFRGSFGEAGDRPGFLPRPRGLATDSAGHVWVVDGALEAVQAFGPKGEFLLYAGHSGAGPGEFSLPGGLWADAADRLYVADTLNARIVVMQYLPGGGP